MKHLPGLGRVGILAAKLSPPEEQPNRTELEGVSVSFTRQARRNAQRDELDTLQYAADPIDRLLAGERLIASITTDRNRALVAACAAYGRGEVAERLGITRQAVYKRLQSSSVGQMVRTSGPPQGRSRIRSLMSTRLPPPMEEEQGSAVESSTIESPETVEPEAELVGDAPSSESSL